MKRRSTLEQKVKAARADAAAGVAERAARARGLLTRAEAERCLVLVQTVWRDEIKAYRTPPDTEQRALLAADCWYRLRRELDATLAYHAERKAAERET